MSKKPYYTSTDLIEAVKRKMSMPLTQVTFSDEDILDFANEEMFLAQIPSIMQYHEEYLVYRHPVRILDNVRRYDIPERAIGMKLRDLFFKDDQGNLFEMTNIGAGNQDFFQQTSFGNNTPRLFFIENNSVVLSPNVITSVPGSLEMVYFLRPNSMVANDRAAICANFTKLLTVDNTTLIAGDSINLGSIILTAGTEFAIGANSAATANNISAAIVALNSDDVTSTVSSDIVTILFSARDMVVSSSNTAALSISSRTGVKCSSVPEHFVDRMLVDFLQTSGGHKTYSFDVRVPNGGVSSDTIFFEDSQIPTDFKIGDYICEQYECIIPQVPSDLHNLLAERTCARILEALGDQAGLQTANAKIAELEQRQSAVINNRVEGAPKKVFARHSLLRYGKFRGSRGSSL